MVGAGDIVGGDMPHEFALYLIRCVGCLGHQSQAMADTKDVRIDSHRRLAKGYALNDISRLATYTRQVEQLVHVGRNLALMLLNEHA